MIRQGRDSQHKAFYEVLSEDGSRSFGKYESYEAAEDRLRQIERFAGRDRKKSVKTSSKDLRAKRAKRAIANPLHEDYAANPSVPLGDRIKNIVERLGREYPDQRVPLKRVRSFTTDATRLQFDEAVFALRKSKKLELFVDASKPTDDGIYERGVGLLYSAKIAPLVAAEDEEEAIEEAAEAEFALPKTPPARTASSFAGDKAREKPIAPVRAKSEESPREIPSAAHRTPTPARASAPATSVTPFAGDKKDELISTVEPSTRKEEAKEAEILQALREEFEIPSTALVVSPQETAPVLHSPTEPARLDQNPAAVYLASLSAGSRRTMREALVVIARMLGGTVETLAWHEIRYQHAQAVRTRLAAKYAPSTVNKMLAALKGVLREAMRLGLMSAEDSARARDLQPIRGSRLPKGRMLSQEELRRLFGAVNVSTSIGRRDEAILAILAGAGLRRAEVAALPLASVRRFETGTEIRVLGKGNKERIVPLPSSVIAALDQWLDVRGREPGPLFPPMTRYGSMLKHELSDRSIALVVEGAEKAAKLDLFSTHDLRRTYISTLLAEGVDLATVQRLAGHSSPLTTARYDRRGEESLREAVKKLSIPIGGVDQVHRG